MAVLVGAACRPRSAGPTPRTVDEVAGVRETWGDYGRRRQFVLGLSVLTSIHGGGEFVFPVKPPEAGL